MLMELQSAKEEPSLSWTLPGGLKPTVQKLPFYMQEKWVSVGASYKRDHQVSFPPFWFVSQEAIVKNDPSFNFATHLDPSPRPRKPWKFNRQREESVQRYFQTPAMSHMGI